MSSLSQSKTNGGRRKRPTVPFEMRKRVNRACVTCRGHKLKCDGRTPCRRCLKHDKECHYSHQEVLRSIGSPSCVTIPSTDAPSKGVEPRTERRQDIPRNVDLGNGSLDDHCLENVEATLIPEINSRSNHSCKDWEIDGIILGNTSTQGASVIVQSQGKTHFEDGSSHWAFFESVSDTFAGRETPRNDTETAYPPFISEFSFTSNNTSSRTGVLCALPPREVVDFLISTFFRFAQANFFYIHPEIFSRKLTAFYSGTQEFSPQENTSLTRSSEFICVLFMVLAIGSQFAELEESDITDGSELSEPSFNRTKLDFTNIREPILSPNPGWRFYEIARRFLPDVIASSSMTSIQACVLQGTFLFSTNARDVCYNVLGLALRMAINMGMHRSLTADTLHPHVRELRNRLWWSVYTAERLFAVEMGRPLAIDDAEIDAPFPLDIAELRVEGMPNNFHNQIALATLCQIMGKIVKTVYSNTASQKNGQVIYLEPLKLLKQELKRWKERLPTSLRTTKSPSRAVAHIHLTYEQAIILLTRTSLNYLASKSHVEQLSMETIKFLQCNAKECLAAAQTSIQIMLSLKERSLLCRFSFHDSLYCSTALYVLLLGTKLESSILAMQETIAQGISVLSTLAKGSQTAASSLRLISQGFQSCLKDHDAEKHKRTHLFAVPYSREKARKVYQAWMAQSEPTAHGLTTSLPPRTPLTAFPLVSGDQNLSYSSEGMLNTTVTSDMTLKHTMMTESGTFVTHDAHALWLPPLEHNSSYLGRDLSRIPDLNFFDHYDLQSLRDFEDMVNSQS